MPQVRWSSAPLALAVISFVLLSMESADAAQANNTLRMQLEGFTTVVSSGGDAPSPSAVATACQKRGGTHPVFKAMTTTVAAITGIQHSGATFSCSSIIVSNDTSLMITSSVTITLYYGSGVLAPDSRLVAAVLPRLTLNSTAKSRYPNALAAWLKVASLGTFNASALAVNLTADDDAAAASGNFPNFRVSARLTTSSSGFGGLGTEGPSPVFLRVWLPPFIPVPALHDAPVNASIGSVFTALATHPALPLMFRHLVNASGVLCNSLDFSGSGDPMWPNDPPVTISGIDLLQAANATSTVAGASSGDANGDMVYSLGIAIDADYSYNSFIDGTFAGASPGARDFLGYMVMAAGNQSTVALNEWRPYACEVLAALAGQPYTDPSCPGAVPFVLALLGNTTSAGPWDAVSYVNWYKFAWVQVRKRREFRRTSTALTVVFVKVVHTRGCRACHPYVLNRRFESTRSPTLLAHAGRVGDDMERDQQSDTSLHRQLRATAARARADQWPAEEP